MATEMERGKETTTQAMSPASVAGDGVTSKRGRSEEEVAGDGDVTSNCAESSSEVAGDGNTTTSKSLAETYFDSAQAEAESEGCRPAMADDKDEEAGETKRTKVIKYHKDHAEFVLRRGRPNLPPPVRRPTATQLEIAADAQKQIDRYDQIWEQYMEKGEAEIEVTDDDEGEEDAAAEVVDDLDKRFPPGTLPPLGDKMVTVEELLVFMGTPA